MAMKSKSSTGTSKHKNMPKAKLLPFLNITDPSDSRNDEFRDQVRRHVMREYQSKQRTKKLESLAGSNLPDELHIVKVHRHATKRKLVCRSKYSKDINGYTHCKMSNRRQKDEEEQIIAVYAHPKSLLGAGMTDPFETVPSDGCKNYFYLINHCEKSTCR